jgi:hypothetical protein
MSSFANNRLFSTTVQFHKGDMILSCDELGLPEGSQFGLITHTVQTCPMDPTETALIICIDSSGSMDSDDKMVLVKNTVKNILRTIFDKKLPIHVHIHTFNSAIQSVFDLTSVREDNLEDLIKKVDRIYATGFTNIELALSTSREIGVEFKKRHHLFLTDGLPTEGNTDPHLLIDLIDPTLPGTYIGYGEEHNHQLLTGFANKNSESSYQLVNNVEMIGNLCGEILFNICYPAVNTIYMSAPFKKDLIYDAKANEWKNNVRVDAFISGKTYRYPMFTTEECAMLVHTQGYSILTGEEVETEIFINPTDERVDLTKEMFRHAADHLLRMPVIDKQKVREMFKKVRTYAREHDLLQDTYYKLIFDDLYTCFNGDQMNITARIISNTRNQTYRSSLTRAPIARQNAHSMSGGLQRSISANYNDLEMDESFDNEENETAIDVYDEDDITRFVSENTQNVCDVTQDMCEIMRAVSS